LKVLELAHLQSRYFKGVAVEFLIKVLTLEQTLLERLRLVFLKMIQEIQV
jgi:hypothetical protein